MVVDAEERKKELMAQNTMSDGMFGSIMTSYHNRLDILSARQVWMSYLNLWNVPRAGDESGRYASANCG